MNLSKLKSIQLWIAIAVAAGGVMLSQGVFIEGSFLGGLIGWVMTFLGSGAAGVQVVKPVEPTEPPAV